MPLIDLKGLNKKDMLRLQEFPKEREKIIRSSSSDAIQTKFVVNQLAREMHPSVQYVKVFKIIEETSDVKTFILVPDIETETKRLAPFRAGQYITIEVPILGGVYHRPYTISSSPKLVLEEDKYAITIKREENGIVSNYFYHEVKVGDAFCISEPTGEFYYEPLRDAKHVIAIVGGNGITPFMSMAEAIYDGTMDFELTILYGVNSKNDIIFRDRLEKITTECEKVNLAYVLVVDEENGFASDFIDKELIDKYSKEENSYFVCGPLGMNERLNEVLKEYHLPNKYFRPALFKSEMDLDSYEEFSLTVLTQNNEFKMKCYARESLLDTMEKNGVVAPSRCHVGECGFCRSKLVSGKVRMFDSHIRSADSNFNYIHPCSSFPESDIVLKLPN